VDTIKDKFPDIPERISGLVELAYNFWWSWHPEARMLFKMLNRAEWKLSVHNPVKMLSNVDRSSFEAAVNDPKFLRDYDIVMAKFQEDMQPGSGWFVEDVAYSPDLPIAFFFGRIRTSPFPAVLCRRARVSCR
jgi:starch phosphorylase